MKIADIVQTLKLAGIEQVESPANRLRRDLSRAGYRCISAAPETWTDGKVLIDIQRPGWD